MPATRAPAKKPKVQSATGRGRKAKPLEPALVGEVFRRFHQAQPEPKGELDYVNPFTLLVAVVLSAQATDEGVNRATVPLFARADTPQQILALGEERFRAAWTEAYEAARLRPHPEPVRVDLLDDVAQAAATVGYELMSALAPRVPVRVDGGLS